MTVNFQESSSAPALHVIVVSIVNQCSYIRCDAEVIAAMEDERGETGHLQKKDVDKAKQLQ